MRHFSHRIPLKLFKKLKALAEIKKCTATQIVVGAVESYLLPYSIEIEQYENDIKAFQLKTSTNSYKVSELEEEI